MFVIVAVVAALSCGGGVFAIGEIAATQEDNRPKLPFQFSILALLVLMLLVSVFFGSYQTFGHAGSGNRAGCLSMGSILTYVLRQLPVMRLRQREESASKESSVARIIDEER